MSYRSRLYNHRNKQSPDAKEKPFFSHQQEGNSHQGKGSFFQAKLNVNKPGDQYEQEADNVAHAVVNNTTASPAVQHNKISSIQRLSSSKEEEKFSTNDARMRRDKEVQKMPANAEKEKEKGIQKKDNPLKEEDKLSGGKPVQKMDDPLKEKEKVTTAPIQKKQDSNSASASPQLSNSIENSAGKGHALPTNTMKEMSSSFGVDFSGVKVHDDTEAAHMNKELNALAFTHGNDVYFNAGKFDPENSTGKFLLAHELTHVVQQNNSLNKTAIQKDDDNSRDPSARDPLAVQPGGPLDMNDQMFTLKRNNDGTFEGCGPIPGGAPGSDNACINADSIDKIKSYFKPKPSTSVVDRPAKCPPERWNTMFNYCCPEDKHIDPQNKFNCIGPKENPPLPIPDAAPQQKGDYELPGTDNQYA